MCACSVSNTVASATTTAARGGGRRGLGGAGRLQQFVGQHVDVVVDDDGRGVAPAVALQHQLHQLQLVLLAQLHGAGAPVQHGH